MSAANTARSTLAAVCGDRVRALQHVLYRAAKASLNRRFHALHDKVCREDVLWRAWVAVRRNNGAPGIDKTTLADVGEYGVTRLLGELGTQVREGTWCPLPARKVLIPKPGSTERRPLAIATVSSYCPSCRRVSGCFPLAGSVLAGTGLAGSLAVSMAGASDTIRRPGVAWCGGRPG